MERYRLRRPNSTHVVEVKARRRDALLRRGYVPVGEDAAPAEEPSSYRELQARAKELGIPANQSREDLERAINQE